jgi:hypothetical protein
MNTAQFFAESLRALGASMGESCPRCDRGGTSDSVGKVHALY